MGNYLLMNSKYEVFPGLQSIYFVPRSLQVSVNLYVPGKNSRDFLYYTQTMQLTLEHMKVALAPRGSQCDSGVD